MTEKLAIDPGLLARLREAYGAIAWEALRASRGASDRTVRTARLHDETARVETWTSSRGEGMSVTSGPVGALILLVELDRRGVANRLGSVNAGREAGFPDGAIVAAWGEETPTFDAQPKLRDLVDLARYALA